MPLILVEDAEPATPVSGEAALYLGTDGLKAKRSDGSVRCLDSGTAARNALANGTFLFAQRQTPGTLTTYSNSTGRTYGFDRWGITTENASAQLRRVDSIASAQEAGLGARHYAELKKITSAGKILFSQVIEASETALYRGRRVRVQFKARNSVGSHTLRLALLQLNTSGTADSIPATFVSAFGAATVDPTWGTNLAAVTPALGNTFSTVVGAGVSSVLTSTFRTYGGVFLVPTTAQNLVVVIFTDGQPAANDILHLSECALFDGDEERPVIVTDLHDELERCKRFYRKTFDLDVAPVQNVGAITGCERYVAVAIGAVNQRSPSFSFTPAMRAVPVVTTFNPLAANAQVRDSTAGDCSAVAVQNLTDRGYAFMCTGNASTAIGNLLSVHATADAEL